MVKEFYLQLLRLVGRYCSALYRLGPWMELQALAGPSKVVGCAACRERAGWWSDDKNKDKLSAWYGPDRNLFLGKLKNPLCSKIMEILAMSCLLLSRLGLS
jgi:hypothetical protein